MALYAESGGHVAKRPRVEFAPQPTQPLQPAAAAAALLANANAAAVAAAHAAATTASTAPPQPAPPSLSQHYIEQQLNRRSSEPEKPNHILLFTVLNPSYPITCEVLHTICAPVAAVQRIVIFKKNGVQAMVEFETVEAATMVKDSLHGCDIYSGCCTLKIEFAKPTKLNVYKNDNDSWDYTNPNLGNKSAAVDAAAAAAAAALTPVSQRPVLLKEPLLMNRSPPTPVVTSSSNGGGGQPPTSVAAAGGALLDNNGFLDGNGSLDSRAAAAAAAAAAGQVMRTPILAAPTLATASPAATGGSPAFHHGGSVCMVYGLCPEKMNATRIFNLFCLYGNVVRVKFLKTKEGCAMVQMGDALAVERVVSNLNNSTFFGSKMQLGFSKQAFLADVQSPYQLPDGSPSFQDFMGSKNNRFINPEMASKNRIQPPSKILHFFNTPPGLEASDVEEVLAGAGCVPRPKCVKLFPSKTERSSSGLIEFESLSEALEALVVCNHQPIANPNGKFPYIMKLCFSSSRSIPATIR